MVAESGARLLALDAVDALRTLIVAARDRHHAEPRRGAGACR